MERSPLSRKGKSGAPELRVVVEDGQTNAPNNTEGEQATATTSSDTTDNNDCLLDDAPVDSSEWEEGIDVIDTLLNPSSPAHGGMTPQQLAGLRKVRMILLGGDAHNQNMHIPRCLMDWTKHSTHSGTHDFLLAQFAGVYKKKPAAKEKVRHVILANRFIQGLRLQAESSRRFEQTNSYAMPEWLTLDPVVQTELAGHLTWENLMRWDFDVFEVARLTRNRPLLFVGWAILGSPYSQHVTRDALPKEEGALPLLDMPGYEFVDEYHIPQQVMVDFLRAIESDYNKKTPYHNNVHAADVLQSLHSMLKGMQGEQFAPSKLDLFSILLAAVIHDVGHPGYNNAFQINSQSDLALEYNDVSVLENMHLSLAFRKLMGSRMENNLNILQGMSEDQISKCRARIIDAVLMTDMTKHFSTVSKIKGIRHSYKSMEECETSDQWEIMHYSLHMADISNPAKPFAIATKWADRCLEEFFLQGDEEKKQDLTVSPLCDRSTTDRADSQIGFIKFVVQPAFEELGQIMPDVASTICPIIEQNLKHWKNENTEEQPPEVAMKNLAIDNKD